LKNTLKSILKSCSEIHLTDFLALGDDFISAFTLQDFSSKISAFPHLFSAFSISAFQRFSISVFEI